MTNAELIDSLRNVYGEKADCYHCHSNMGCYGTVCMEYLCHDAADALEAAEKRIAELEAQMPKEGEWIGVNPMVDTEQCSICGWNIPTDEFESNYCPNCGAKMNMKKGKLE